MPLLSFLGGILAILVDVFILSSYFQGFEIGDGTSYVDRVILTFIFLSVVGVYPLHPDK